MVDVVGGVGIRADGGDGKATRRETDMASRKEQNVNGTRVAWNDDGESGE